jgi:hypothetical protein
LNLLFFFFTEQTFQLAELLRAVGSPLAAVEDKDDALLTPKVGQRDLFPVQVFEREIRRRLTHLDPVEIGWGQVRAVFWP